MLCRMQASVIQHHQRGFHVQAPVRHLLCRSRLSQAATHGRWGSMPAQGLASCRGQTSTCHSAAGDSSSNSRSGSSGGNDTSSQAISRWSIADQQAVAQQAAQAPWLLKPGIDVPWWPHLVWCDMLFDGGRDLTISTRLLEGIPGLSPYLQRTELPVQLTFLVQSDDWSITDYIKSHKHAHLQPAGPYCSAAQSSSSSSSRLQPSKTLGPFMAVLRKAGHTVRVDELVGRGCAALAQCSDLEELGLEAYSLRVVLQEREPAAGGVLAVKLHLQPGMPALEALPAGSRSGGRWGVQPISRAGEGMGLQVFPSSVWEFVQLGREVCFNKPSIQVGIPKVLICSQVPAEASYPLPVNVTVTDVDSTGRRTIYEAQGKIFHGNNYLLRSRLPTSSLSPAYQDRTISRMVLTTDSPPRLIVDLAPAADMEPDSTPAAATAPAATQQASVDSARRRRRRTSRSASIQCSAVPAPAPVSGLQWSSPLPAQPWSAADVTAGRGVPSPAVMTDAGYHGREYITPLQQQQQQWAPAADPKGPRESFDAATPAPADPARAPAPSSGSGSGSSSQSQLLSRQQQIAASTQGDPAASTQLATQQPPHAAAGGPTPGNSSVTAAGCLAAVKDPFDIELRLQQLLTCKLRGIVLSDVEYFEMMRQLRVCFRPFRVTGIASNTAAGATAAAEQSWRLRTLQVMYAYVRAAEECGGDDGTLVLEEIEALLEACSSFSS